MRDWAGPEATSLDPVVVRDLHDTAQLEYEPPSLIDIGHFRELTKGSSSSGSADANSQYYW